MNEKISQYLDGVFAPYDDVKSVAELKADLTGSAFPWVHSRAHELQQVRAHRGIVR